MLYTHDPRMPYSSEGLAALQKTLKLHANLTSPVIRIDPVSGVMRVESLQDKSDSEFILDAE